MGEKKEIARKYRVNNLRVVVDLQKFNKQLTLPVNHSLSKNTKHRVCHKFFLRKEMRLILTKFLFRKKIKNKDS